MFEHLSRNPDRPSPILGGQRGGLKHRPARLSTSPALHAIAQRPVWALLAVAVLGRCALVLSGWPETSLIADDAYYYFTIARHLALGDGPTFDGIAVTNGFQPLWQFLLVPLFQLPPLWAPVRATGLLEIGLDVASAFVLRRWASELFGPRRATLAAATWLLLPGPFLLGLRGMEASLAALFVLLALWLSSRAKATRPWQLGLLLGLAGLARVDHLLALGSSLALLELVDRQRPKRARWTRLSILAATSGLVVAPWFLWCRLRFGSFTPVSGQVKLYTDQIVSALPNDFSRPAAALQTLAYALFAPLLSCVRWLAGEEFSPMRWTIPCAALSLLAGALLLWQSARELHRRGAGRVVLVIGVFVAVHQMLFGLVWRSYSVWYAHPLMAICCLLFAAPACDGRRLLRRAAIAALAVVQIVLVVLYVGRVEHGARGAEIAWRGRFDRVLRAAPLGGRIGAWDAGAAGYIALQYPQITIVNLDGLVNNLAFAAVREGRYAEYLLNELDYLIQSPQRARMYLAPDELAAFLAEFERRAASTLDN